MFPTEAAAKPWRPVGRAASLRHFPVFKSQALAVAADVFLYIGELSGVFQGVRSALRDGGFFGFSVETSDEQDFLLRPNRHYAHSGAYLRKLAEKHGFALDRIESQVIRQDNAIDVVGYLVVLSCS